MKILDVNNIEIFDPNLKLGYLSQDKLFVTHHEAIPAVAEEFHYEYKVYPNGGRDRIKVVDVPAVAGKDAWDEYEEIQRYIEFTEEQLTEMNKPSLEDQLAAVNEELITTQLALCDLYEKLVAVTGE